MSEPAGTERCYHCGAPGLWKITAEKQSEPLVLVVYWSCEKCRPFDYELKQAS